MASNPGWYPDPSGQPGTLRYWDGQSWSAETRALAGPATTQTAVRPGPAPRGGRGWLIGLLVALAVVVVVVVLVIRYATAGSGDIADPGPTTPVPGGSSANQVCPEPDNGTAGPQPGDGRVHAGALSYPKLSSPWAAPRPDNGVAFGRGVLIQTVTTESEGSKGTWFAAVLLGELVAGDGFFTPQDGAAIVVTCVIGTYYGGSAVTRDDRRNEAMSVDGHDAWVIESQLGYDVPGVKAKSERLIVVVVDTGSGAAGLFYASVPENAEKLLPDARKALAGLTVDS